MIRLYGQYVLFVASMITASEAQENVRTPDASPAQAPLVEQTTTNDGRWRLFSEPSDLTLLFDRIHAGASSQLVETANAVDRFFGARELEDDARVAQVRVRLQGSLEEQGKTATRVQTRVRIPLPGTERRLQLAIDSLTEDTDILTPEESTELEEEESFTGLRWVLLAGQSGFAFFDFGGRLRSGFEPEIAIKAQRSGAIGTWRWKAFQSGFWNEEDEFGERTRFDLERAFGAPNLLRTRCEVLWTETSQGLEPRLSVGFAHVLNPKTAVSIAGGVSTHARPSFIIDDWSASVRLRRQLHRRWFFVEVAPGAGFPRDRDYRFTPSISATFEIVFGGVDSAAAATP